MSQTERAEYLILFEDYGDWLVSGRTQDAADVPALLAESKAYRPKLAETQHKVVKVTITTKTEPYAP